MKSIKTIFIILAVALTGCAEKKITERQNNILAVILADEVRHFGENGQMTLPEIDIPKANAHDLTIEYERNEIITDAQYKNKTVRVVGKVQSVGVDIAGHGYASLKGHNMFANATAYMKKKEDLMTVNPDQMVSMVCRVHGKLLTMVALRDCQFSQDWAFDALKEVKIKIVSQIVAPKESAPTHIKNVANLVQSLDKRLAQDTQCGIDFKKCLAEIQKLM